jgi:hypothetical protein
MSHDTTARPFGHARPALRAAALVLVLALVPAAASAAVTLSVKYRSASNVYVDGGRAQGLAVGDRLTVLSGRQAVAELEVVFVAEQSASCRVVSETRTVRAGDAVVPRRKAAPEGATVEAPPPPAGAAVAAPAPVAPPAPAPSVGTSRSEAAPWGRARGGVSFGYYKVTDDTSSAFDFEQSTARADVTISDLGGRPLTLTTRLRSRQDVRARTLSSLGPSDRRQDRLYELALRYEPPGEGFALEVGRIGVSRFVGVGYLDGALVRVGGRGGGHRAAVLQQLPAPSPRRPAAQGRGGAARPRQARGAVPVHRSGALHRLLGLRRRVSRGRRAGRRGRHRHGRQRPALRGPRALRRSLPGGRDRGGPGRPEVARRRARDR